ncbi:MAG: B12-binding domain-containing radical SAM protein [Bacteroidetes bacterium]|nr:B12-binding domain-containing radical SAM protein [Bacteroidota bacterium]
MPGNWKKSLSLRQLLFKGEAEENLLAFLQNSSLQNSEKPQGITIGKLDSRIKLDEKAFADYSDYDLTAYLHKDGVSIETSRGCVAQCSFCSETYFWKFRSMTPLRVIEEMKYQIQNYGVKRFWFVDSLVNGDLKNFTTLVDLIIENELKIGWNSYSRCDGRMTKEFIDKVALSGCTALSYGVESGSQKVLDDMRKKIAVWEIYNNLKDTYTTNKIWTHVNWLIGFPTEENIDYYHSNLLIFNVRKYIHQLSPGMGCGISHLTDLLNNYQTYGIAWKEKPWDNQLFGSWFTEGFKNTQLHRFIRIKLFHVWLEILKKHAGSVIENPQRHDDTTSCFKFKTPHRATTTVITPDDCIDFNRISPQSASSFISAHAASDYFAFFYGLFQVFGAFKMTITFDPEKDISSWGSIAVNYRASVTFDINDQGYYHCTIDHQLKHYGINSNTEETYRYERNHLHGDMSFKDVFNTEGNVADWKTEHTMVKETVHEVYRNKSKGALAQCSHHQQSYVFAGTKARPLP